MFNTTTITVTVSVLASFFGYLWWRKRKESEEDDFCTLSLCLPKPVVYTLQQKINIIENIKTKTCCNVRFSDDVSNKKNDKILISGNVSDCLAAKILIQQAVLKFPQTLSYYFLIPKYVFDAQEQEIQEIVKAANIEVVFRDSDNLLLQTNENNKIELIGSVDKLSFVIEKLDELIKNFEDDQLEFFEEISQLPEIVQAEIEDQGSSSSSEEIVEKPVEKLDHMFSHWPEKDEKVEVYVSALVNPSIFYVQMVNTVKYLDSLQEEMTIFYKNINTIFSEDVELGSLVAAPFLAESTMTLYRAVIFKILNEDEVDLFYLDFGDKHVTPLNEIYKLDQRFFGLPFQSIEVALANVKPYAEKWNNRNIDYFEELTNCSQWYKLTAKLVTYVAQPEANEVRSKGRMVPAIELIDENDTEAINLTEDMINCGFAVPDEASANEMNQAVQTSTESFIERTKCGDLKNVYDDTLTPPRLLGERKVVGTPREIN